MNKKANYIKNRLSLRPPQVDSLSILSEIYNAIFPNKNRQNDLPDLLSIVKAKYPTCTDFERDFPSICFALATGVGKTRLMGASIAYLFLEHGVKNFFVLAPNLTIYNKLLDDFSNPTSTKYVFKGIAELAQHPPRIINGDNYNQFSGNELFETININVFNISKINSETRGGKEPRIKRLTEYLGESYFNYLSGLDDLVILMDESHHYRADRGMSVINELDPILGLEYTATPQTQKASKFIKFKNVVYEYSLAKAIEDGFVKIPSVATRENFNADNYSAGDLDRLKVLDGIRLHENTKSELAIYAQDYQTNTVKPFVLIVATDTNHAAQLKEMIQKDDFFSGYYADKVMDIHSKQKGAEKDENIELLLKLEDPDNRIEIVIHVNMLKEGWDVTNLYTIIPLRTSASKTLTEQTLGRGLRLPYGKQTGVASVDALTVVQHDKFQAIVDEANKPDSIIKLANVITIDDNTEHVRKEVVSIKPQFEADLEARRANLAKLSPTAKEKEIVRIKTDEVILPFVSEVLKKAKSHDTSQFSTPEVISSFKAEYKKKLQSEGNIFAEGDAEEAVKRYVETIKSVVDKTIPIPRLAIVPSSNARLVFDDFDLETDKMTFQPGSETIVTRELQSGKTRTIEGGSRGYKEKYVEDHIVNLLVDKDEIWYDLHKDLLYKLSNQAVKHFQSYLDENSKVLNVVMNYKHPISEQIYQQMMSHHRIEHDGFEEPTIPSKPYSEIKQISVSKVIGDRYYDYKETVEPLSKIREKVFTGFTKSYHSHYKFDSNTERLFAAILEQDTVCLKWLKPSLSQFNIWYGRPTKNYTPDFIVETSDYIAMVETKKKSDIESIDVQNKAKAAVHYCQQASAFTTSNNGKPWKYVMIPHDVVLLNMTFQHLVNSYTIDKQG
jgi:type III restriction enzyme